MLTNIAVIKSHDSLLTLNCFWLLLIRKSRRLVSLVLVAASFTRSFASCSLELCFDRLCSIAFCKSTRFCWGLQQPFLICINNLSAVLINRGYTHRKQTEHYCIISCFALLLMEGVNIRNIFSSHIACFLERGVSYTLFLHCYEMHSIVFHSLKSCQFA